MAVQPDGKVVVAGQAQGQYFALARYGSTGTPDGAFGNGGLVVTAFAQSYPSLWAIGLQADGKIVAAGSVDAGDGGFDVALARYAADGSLDPSFGGSGTVVTASPNVSEEAQALAVQPDGKIVVAGYSLDANGNSDFLVARYTAQDSTLHVSIDVRPSSIELTSQGVIPVVVYTTAGFDARTAAAGTVRFAGASAAHSAFEDVDGDGDLDLVLQFRTQATNLRSLYERLLTDDLDGDGVLDSTRQVATVALTGETTAGQQFEGSDSVTLFLSGRSLRDLLKRLFG